MPGLRRALHWPDGFVANFLTEVYGAAYRPRHALDHLRTTVETLKDRRCHVGQKSLSVQVALLSRWGLPYEGLHMLNESKRRGVRFNGVAYDALLRGLGRQGDRRAFEEVRALMRFDGYMATLHTHHAVLMLLQAEKRVQKARRSGDAAEGPPPAVPVDLRGVLDDLEADGVAPTAETVALLIPLCEGVEAALRLPAVEAWLEAYLAEGLRTPSALDVCAEDALLAAAAAAPRDAVLRQVLRRVRAARGQLSLSPAGWAGLIDAYTDKGDPAALGKGLEMARACLEAPHVAFLDVARGGEDETPLPRRDGDAARAADTSGLKQRFKATLDAGEEEEGPGRRLPRGGEVLAAAALRCCAASIRAARAAGPARAAPHVRECVALAEDAYGALPAAARKMRTHEALATVYAAAKDARKARAVAEQLKSSGRPLTHAIVKAVTLAVV